MQVYSDYKNKGIGRIMTYRMAQIVITLLLFIILHSRAERDEFYICTMNLPGRQRAGFHGGIIYTPPLQTAGNQTLRD
ncbi:hypothetical protein D7D25_14475 [Proteiniphilum sp. X52]|nr:hypothetical protein D7D25_14475 [Proteiniphilum sp. X52]